MEALNSTTSSGNDSINNDLMKQVTPVLNFFRRVVYDAAFKACASGAVGVFLRVMGMPLCWPFFGHSAGMFATRLVVNLTKEYDTGLKQMVNECATKAHKLHKQYPHLRVALFVAAVVASAFFSSIGLMLGLILGTASALTVDLELCLKRQHVRDAADGESSIGSFINQLL